MSSSAASETGRLTILRCPECGAVQGGGIERSPCPLCGEFTKAERVEVVRASEADEQLAAEIRAHVESKGACERLEAELARVSRERDEALTKRDAALRLLNAERDRANDESARASRLDAERDEARASADIWKGTAEGLELDLGAALNAVDELVRAGGPDLKALATGRALLAEHGRGDG